MSIELLGNREDQLSNQFEAVFPSGIPNSIDEGDGDQLILSIVDEIPMPDVGFETGEFYWNGLKIPYKIPKDKSSKDFSLKFDIDGKLHVYDSIDAWVSMGYDRRNGVSMPLFFATTDLIIKPKNFENKSKSGIFAYSDVFCYNYKVTSWNHTGNEPLQIECNFRYLDFDKDD
jgi:hypothetical protein